MSERLLPCPFCNAEPRIAYATLTTSWSVWCANDACNVGCETTGHDKETVSDAWNTRPSPPGEAVAWRWKWAEGDFWKFSEDDEMARVLAAATGKTVISEPLYASPAQPGWQAEGKLSVWYGPMPESNGKSNFTAILHRGDLVEGHTIARSEYPDRIRYEADRVRYLIGELSECPNVLDYDGNKHSGYAPPPSSSAEMEKKGSEE